MDVGIFLLLDFPQLRLPPTLSAIVSFGGPVRRKVSPPSPPLLTARSSSRRVIVSGLYWNTSTLQSGFMGSTPTMAAFSRRDDTGKELMLYYLCGSPLEIADREPASKILRRKACGLHLPERHRPQWTPLCLAEGNDLIIVLPRPGAQVCARVQRPQIIEVVRAAPLQILYMVGLQSSPVETVAGQDRAASVSTGTTFNRIQLHRFAQIRPECRMYTNRFTTRQALIRIIPIVVVTLDFDWRRIIVRPPHFEPGHRN